MHSQKRRELTEDSTQFLITSAGEPGISANTNDSELVDLDEQGASEVNMTDADVADSDMIDSDTVELDIAVASEMEEPEGEVSLESSPEIAAIESETNVPAANTQTELSLNPNQSLGSYLRSEREAQDTTISDIAKTTKIPKASLLALEEGRFSDLPGDVFVRGFLRSYSRFLKLNGDDVIRRYAQCGLCPAPVSSDMADSLLAPNQRRARSFSSTSGEENATPKVAEKNKVTAALAEVKASSKKRVTKVIKDAFDLARSSSESTTENAAKSVAKTSNNHKIEVVDMSSPAIEAVELAQEKQIRVFVPPALNFGEERASRGPLTLGVIILVVVATLTMSYLLSRPGTSTEGFTQLDQKSLQGSDSLEETLVFSPTQLG